MDRQQNDVPLSPLPENSSLDDDSNSSDQTSTGAPATLSSSFNLRRRRRDFFRLSRLGSDSRASSSRSLQASNLRPEAAEFVPSATARMPTKRKASSSARSGKSVVLSPRGNSANPDHPILRAEDLFGRDALAQKDGDALESLLDDDDHSEIFEMNMQELHALTQNNPPATPQNRNTIREALNLARSRPAERSRRTSDAPQSSSAILYSCDNIVASADQAGHATRLQYLPLGPVTAAGGKSGSITKDANLTVLPSYRLRIDNPTLKQPSTKITWPLDELPKEIFDLITDYLSRDDIKSMRLVRKEFERKVSDTLFNTSVVPFNTELYDMIDEDVKASTRASQAHLQSRAKGKGRARDNPDTGSDNAHTGLHWQNAKDDADGKVYRGHGLRVFQGFGPHIKKFGMSFEVTEGQLARPPVKRELDQVESYHGAYDWPPHQYTRFSNLAGLERTADETLRMKAAFANLKKVQELGLSIESGLGWLNGPDKSVRARIFERPSAVFGQSHCTLDHQMLESRNFWAALQACHRSVGVTGNTKELTLARKTLAKSISELPGLQGTRFADPSSWPSIASSNVNAATTTAGLPEDTRQGVLYTTLSHPEFNPPYDKSALVPSELRKEQKEWLLETEWAQRAFIDSYSLAIIDNPLVVANVRTLNIAKVSSSFLPILGRPSFWDALPSLTDVTIHVKPDWRTVEKDNAGFAETRLQIPSEASKLFYRCILRDRICIRPSITKLNIGWVGGGEHGEGMFARNNNILPAPITQPEHSIAPSAGFGLVFKYVEHLTLYNCWITPPALEELVRNHSDKSLKKLTLHSVSLTAHPRFPPGGQAGQVAQAVAAMQAGGAQAPAHLQNFLNGLPHGVPQPPAMHPQNAQQVQNMPFAWPALNNIPNHPQAGQFQQQMFNQLFINHNNNAAILANAGGVNPQWIHGPNAGAAAPNGPLQQNPPMPNHPQINNVQDNAHWSDQHREGSWPEILDKISPGLIFSDYLPQPAPWEEQLPPRPETKLRSIELKSVGYARLLNHGSFDQFQIQAVDDHHLSVWFRARHAALAPAMMTNGDRFMARIVQHIPNRELVALLLAWGLREGWEDREKAEQAEYDGLLPGGTGRVSGTIYRGMPLISDGPTTDAT